MSEQINYKKTIWVNDVTYLNADNFNNIEEGVELALNRSKKNEDTLTTLTADDTVENSIAYNIQQANNALKNELIGDYNDFDGTQHETIASAVKDFQGQIDGINGEIDAIDEKIGESENPNSESILGRLDTIETHVNAKTGNPHKVTASQVGAYTKKEVEDKFASLTEEDKQTVKNATYAISAGEAAYAITATEAEHAISATSATKVGELTEAKIIELISNSGGGSGGSTINIDSTVDLVYDGDKKLYEKIINDISDMVPQNIFITFTPKEAGLNVNGTLYVYDSSPSPNTIFTKTINEDQTCKITLDKAFDSLIIRFQTEMDNLQVKVSYLTEGGVEKLFDYVDLTALTKLDNLISSGKGNPDETITSQYYFKYSE